MEQVGLIITVVPKILKDKKIESYIGASVVSNYEKLPKNIREKLFVIWEKATLDDKEGILGSLVYLYRIIVTKEYVFKSSIITRIIKNWEKCPRLFQDYAANNWKEFEGMEMEYFFADLFEKYDVFPELVENILYESSRDKDIDVAISAVSEAIRSYSKLSFEITQIIPSVLERIKSEDRNLFSSSCCRLRTSIIDNWDELPEDIREFAFLKREAKAFCELSEEIRFLEYMFENYQKFPGKAKEYLKDLLESAREKVRSYIITNIFDKVGKSPYSGDLFSYLEEDIETRIFINNLIVANYREVDKSLKHLVIDAAKDKNIKLRYCLAISIMDMYDDLPRAVQDLALEISKNLPTKEKEEILEYMRNTLKKTEG